MDRSILKSMVEMIQNSDVDGVLGTDERLQRHINQEFRRSRIHKVKLVEFTILADLLEFLSKSNESGSGCHESADDSGECDD